MDPRDPADTQSPQAPRGVARHFQALVRHSSECVMVVDANLQVIEISAAIERMFGADPEGVRGQPVGYGLDERDRTRLVGACRQVVENPSEHCRVEIDAPHRDGRPRHLEIVVSNHLSDPGIGGLVANIRDISEVQALQHERDQLVRVFDITDDLVGLFDASGRLIYMNSASRRWLEGVGQDPDAVDGATWLGGSTDVPGFRDAFLADPQGLERWSGEVSAVAPDGSERFFLSQILVHRDAQRSIECFSVIARDITERRRLEDSLQRQATHDPLTGLPNRVLLFDRIERAAQGLRGHGGNHSVALLFIDIDHFKAVNDSIGHARGDRVLLEVAERIGGVVRPGDTVARFGGDEFVVLCERLDHPEDAVVIAHRVETALRRPIDLDGRPIELAVSIGIAYSDPDAADPLALLQDADAAMYRAKSDGRGQWVIFDEQLRGQAARRQSLETSLRRTRHGEELELQYQPVVSLATGRITGVEALVRWRRDGVLVPPADFVPVAEETGLIVPIGEWVLRRAAEQVGRWQQLPGHETLRLAVNVSPRQIHHSSFASAVAGVADGSVLRRDTLWLEITESLLLDDLAAASERLERLARLGARLSLDDFGTGYSSLTYLRHFPVDAVKLDRSFVAGIGADAEDTAIVTAVVDLARALGKECVAEGVETADQYDLLRSLGCDSAQGYLFSRPVPPEALESMLVGDGVTAAAS